MSDKEKVMIVDMKYFQDWKVQLTHSFTLLLVSGTFIGLSAYVGPLLIAGTITTSLVLLYNAILTLAWFIVFKLLGKYYRQYLISFRGEVK